MTLNQTLTPNESLPLSFLRLPPECKSRSCHCPSLHRGNSVTCLWRPSSNVSLAHREWLEQIKPSFMVSKDPSGIVSFILTLWKFLNFSPWISSLHAAITACVCGSFWTSTPVTCLCLSCSSPHLHGAQPPPSLSFHLEIRHLRRIRRLYSYNYNWMLHLLLLFHAT